jgi:hypothetical protein
MIGSSRFNPMTHYRLARMGLIAAKVVTGRNIARTPRWLPNPLNRDEPVAFNHRNGASSSARSISSDPFPGTYRRGGLTDLSSVGTNTMYNDRRE